MNGFSLATCASRYAHFWFAEIISAAYLWPLWATHHDGRYDRSEGAKLSREYAHLTSGLSAPERK